MTLIYLDELASEVLEVLISTLTRFFTFAINFQPEKEILNKTTHTSEFTYYFLEMSANILTKCSLSEEMQARHGYILQTIAIRLDEGKERDYLFFTASIYASSISVHSAGSPLSRSCRNFLQAVKSYHSKFPESNQNPELYVAVLANEVGWDDINTALEPPGPSNTAVKSESHGVNGMTATNRPRNYDQDHMSSEMRKLGEGAMDVGEPCFPTVPNVSERLIFNQIPHKKLY